MCEFLGRTPSEIGKIRQDHPSDLAFIEQHIIWEAEERMKEMKEIEKKSKPKPRHRR